MQIATLADSEFAELREWLLAREAKAWDAQFEADVRAAKLDALAKTARRAHAEGETTKF